MSATLVLSARPGDAVFSVGALIAALPGEKHHARLYPTPDDKRAYAESSDEADAYALLGATHAVLTAADSAGTASAKTVEAAVAALLDAYDYANVLAPLGLGTHDEDGALTQAIAPLKSRYPATRFLHYYELPYATQHRQRFPELAFARPIRGLAEADADAATLQWKARGGGSGGVLQTKLAACQLLDALLLHTLFPSTGDLPAPTNPLEVDAAVRRAIGTREWVQLA